MDDYNKAKLDERIKDADLSKPVIDDLRTRLSVASHEGVAKVMRDFEGAMAERRKQVLQSHRRAHQGLAPRNKLCLAFCLK